MANKCPSCGKFFSLTDGAKCNKCSVVCHRQCNNVSPESKVNNKWMCKQCKAKTINNTVQECGILQKKDNEISADVETQQEQTSLVQEIRMLRTEMSSFRAEMIRISSLVTEFNLRLDTIEQRVSDLEDTTNSVQLQEYIQQNQKLSSTVDILQKQLNESEQEKLLNDAEITGVAETSGENLVHIVLTIAQKIGVALDERDIVNVQRRGARRPASAASADGWQGAGAGDMRSRAARPIVVRVCRRQLRNELLRAARVRRNADTSGTTVGDKPQRFYLNEHLTSANRNLFYQAREQLGRNKNWRFVWTKNGRIFARKDSSSKIFSIHSDTELKQVFSM